MTSTPLLASRRLIVADSFVTSCGIHGLSDGGLSAQWVVLRAVRHRMVANQAADASPHTIMGLGLQCPKAPSHNLCSNNGGAAPEAHKAAMALIRGCSTISDPPGFSIAHNTFLDIAKRTSSKNRTRHLLPMATELLDSSPSGRACTWVHTTESRTHTRQLYVRALLRPELPLLIQEKLLQGTPPHRRAPCLRRSTSHIQTAKLPIRLTTLSAGGH